MELAQTIRKGGKEGEKAKDKLVTSNLRFVVSVAKQYQHQGVPLSDLINEARREAALNEHLEKLTNEMQRYLDAIQESENLIAKLKERNVAEEIINDEIELISSNKQKAEELKKKIKALNEQKD